MKVDGNRPEQLADVNQSGSAAQAAHAAQSAERLQQQRADDKRVAEPRGDRVEVSSDARLVETAVRAATSAPDVRPEVVERARVKLESGELGRDLFRLADKMIDSLVTR